MIQYRVKRITSTALKWWQTVFTVGLVAVAFITAPIWLIVYHPNKRK